MVTTTTPRATSLVASYSLLSPTASAPPWIHTITGRPSSRSDSRSPCLLGAYTLRNRQSSVSDALPNGVNPCGQWLPNCVASCVTTEGVTGCGGFQRRLRVTGWAYPTPRNCRTVPDVSSLPWNVPSGAATNVEAASDRSTGAANAKATPSSSAGNKLPRSHERGGAIPCSADFCWC